MDVEEITHDCGAKTVFPHGQLGDFCMQVWGLTHVAHDCPTATPMEQAEAMVDLTAIIMEIEVV